MITVKVTEDEFIRHLLVQRGLKDYKKYEYVINWNHEKREFEIMLIGLEKSKPFGARE